MGEEAYADYRRAIHDPATVLAMMEDYRAGLGPDRRHDDEDRRRPPVACPTWSCGPPTTTWRPVRRRPRRLATWVPDLRGHPFPSGHHMAEDNPGALADELLRFLAGAG